MPPPDRLLRIWVVEDDHDDFVLLKDAFDRAQALCLALRVNDGEELLGRLEALAAGQATPWPDLLLLDIRLPGRDGWEVLESLKTDPRFRRIPVVVWTGSESEADVERAYESGAASYIVKPESFQALVEKVRGLRRYWTELVELPRQPGPS